jgi:CRP-like cAMP-binding protein
MEILGKMGGQAAAAVVVRAVGDTDPGVRAAALRAMAQLRVGDVGSAINAAARDGEANVRLEAANTWAALGSSRTAHVPEPLVSLLSDPAPNVRARAALALLYDPHRQSALAVLDALLNSKDAATLTAGLEAVIDGGELLEGDLDSDRILSAIKSPDLQVRRTACRALAAIDASGRVAALSACLADADTQVRREAAASLKTCGNEGQAAALHVLMSGHPLAADAAVDALTVVNTDVAARLRTFIVAEIPRLRELRSHAASLPPANRACAMLSSILVRKAESGEERVVKILGLMGDSRAMGLVSRSLHTKDAEARAAAVEALDTLADKGLRRDIIALLEDEPLHAPTDAVLQALLADDDAWCRALAVRAIQELELADAEGPLRKLAGDPESFVRDAAAAALKHFQQADQMKTLQTISTLERVLLLRDVPIFAELSVEDLEHIAAIAQEEWHPSHAEVCHEGDHGDLLYIITQGQLDVVRSQNGGEELLARRGPGEFVGEMAIIDAAPRSATLRANSDVRLLSIEGGTFNGILRERPDVALAVMRNLSRRLRSAPG